MGSADSLELKKQDFEVVVEGNVLASHRQNFSR